MFFAVISRLKCEHADFTCMNVQCTCTVAISVYDYGCKNIAFAGHIYKLNVKNLPVLVYLQKYNVLQDMHNAHVHFYFTKI